MPKATKKAAIPKEKKPSRKDYKFILELYPDTEDYDCASVLQNLASNSRFEFVSYILHDSDTFQWYDDPVVKGEAVEGQPKKPHYHVYLRLTHRSPTTIFAVGKLLQINDRWIQFADNEIKCLRYQLHLDHPDKYQYDPLSVVTFTNSVRGGVSPLIDNVAKLTEDEYAKIIFDAIWTQGMTRFSELLSWGFENGCYATIRRGASIWRAVLSDVYSSLLSVDPRRGSAVDPVSASVNFDSFVTRTDVPQLFRDAASAGVPCSIM